MMWQHSQSILNQRSPPEPCSQSFYWGQMAHSDLGHLHMLDSHVADLSLPSWNQDGAPWPKDPHPKLHHQHRLAGKGQGPQVNKDFSGRMFQGLRGYPPGAGASDKSFFGQGGPSLYKLCLYPGQVHNVHPPTWPSLGVSLLLTVGFVFFSLPLPSPSSSRARKQSHSGNCSLLHSTDFL